MNARNILILTLVLAVLGGGLWYRKAARRGENVLTAQSLHGFVEPGLAASVDAVELARPGSATVRLEKRAGRWVIPVLGGAPANEGSVGRMLDAVAALRGELRSADPSVLADYGLQDDQATILSLEAGGRETARLLLGKGDFRNVFVRAAGSPEAYAAPGSILGQIGALGPTLSAQFWIDGTLAALSGDAVREIRLTAPGLEAVLSRRVSSGGDSANATRGVEWDFRQSKGKGLDRARMEGVLAALERVPVTEAVYPAQTGPSFPTHRLEAVTEAGTTVLEGAPEGDRGFLVRVAGSPHLYRMAASVSARLFPEPAGTAK